MDPATINSFIKQQVRGLKPIWIAMFAWSLIFILLLYLIKVKGGYKAPAIEYEAAERVAKYVFWIVGILTGLVAIKLKPVLLSKYLDNATTLFSITGGYATVMIVGLALSDVISVFGFLMFLLFEDFQSAVLMALVGMVFKTRFFFSLDYLLKTTNDLVSKGQITSIGDQSGMSSSTKYDG